MNHSRFYDAYGEVLYAIMRSSGNTNPNSTALLTEIIGNHPKSPEILWSVNYELQKQSNLKDSYFKALEKFKKLGPNQEHTELFRNMNQVAKIGNSKLGLKEAKLISIFKKNLITHFKNHEFNYN